jgi:hypothetical protein
MVQHQQIVGMTQVQQMPNINRRQRKRRHLLKSKADDGDVKFVDFRQFSTE